MNLRVYKTLAVLLLSGMAGCASGPFHRKTVPPPALQPQPPELSQSPLYSPEMSEGNPRTPTLPTPPEPTVATVQPPEPPPKKPHRMHKPKPLPVETVGLPYASGPGANGSPTASGAPPQAAEKKVQDTQQAKIGSPASSPIGELTTGDSAEVAATSRHTSELIKSTRDGLDGIKRPLSAEERKTAIEISTFLTRAEQALRNGDADGAQGLATKAKLLLDELTQS